MPRETGRFRPETYLQERHPDVRVIQTDLPGQLQGCVDHAQRIIWLDWDLDPVARRCTLAYEIGQLEQGPMPTDRRLAVAFRRAAEEWAALMLVPTEAFAAAWGGCLSLTTMADQCGVDLATFRARIRAASDADQDAAMLAITQAHLSA